MEAEMTAINKKRNGKWIWTADWTQEDSRSPRLVWFYTEIEGKSGKAAGTDGIRITADCRYKLYIDGEPVQYGPAKGDHEVHYLDTVNPGSLQAVGVHSGYGPAQRIYVKRGYVFDGSGVWYQGKQLEQYAPCCNDDDLVLFMIKEL